MARQRKKKIYLFDPITCNKKEVDYDFLNGLLNIPLYKVSLYIRKKQPLYNIGAFLINEEYTRKDLIELMNKWQTEEVKTEAWKDLPGGRTQVSNLGRFRNRLKNGSYKFVIPGVKGNGHMYVKSWIDGEYKFRSAQRLVATMFIENTDATKNCVAHKSGIQYDNRANNLEWVTKQEVSSRSGKLVTNYVNKIDVETEEIIDTYLNVAEASRESYICRRSINLALSGTSKTAGGYKWERV